MSPTRGSPNYQRFINLLGSSILPVATARTRRTLRPSLTDDAPLLH